MPSGWRLRYGGVSLNHQSNGQSLPLSRSWNRVIAGAGLELGDQVAINASLWQRLPEDAAHYPDIDLHYMRRNGKRAFTRKDGTPYPGWPKETRT